MTLATQITADVSTVFLNASDFARSITHYPLGVKGNAATITALVDLDDETYGFQVPAIDNEFGTRIKRYAQLEVLSTLTITCSERPVGRDQFLIGTEAWHAERILGRDGTSGLQRVLVSREEGASTKLPRLGR